MQNSYLAAPARFSIHQCMHRHDVIILTIGKRREGHFITEKCMYNGHHLRISPEYDFSIASSRLMECRGMRLHSCSLIEIVTRMPF